MDLVLDSSRQVSGTKDSVSYECETKHVTNPTLLRREASECLRLICKKIVFNYAYVSLGPCRSTLLLFLCMAADKWVCFYALNPSHWSPLLLPMNKNGFFFFSLYCSNLHAMIFVLYSTIQILSFVFAFDLSLVMILKFSRYRCCLIREARSRLERDEKFSLK